jgi:hypothetical protein
MKCFQENPSMLGFLTTESTTPMIVVNTLFRDSWETIHKMSTSSVDAMPVSERSDIRQRLAQRLHLQYILEISPYFDCKEDDRQFVPGWRCGAALRKASAQTAPWEAVWNRTIRKLVCSLPDCQANI